MEELIRIYNESKKKGALIMQRYAKNRLIRFYDYYIEVME